MRNSEDKAAIRRRFAEIDTANVADVLDKKGLTHQGLSADFRPESGERLAGWAYTIIGQLAPFHGDGDPEKMQACQGIGPDEVSVWSGDGKGVCYFGELIALGMAERGSVGALVDGGVRDIKWLREHGFPVFATYRTPVQSIGRWQVRASQQPAYLAGATSQQVTVRPGDFVLCDQDGGVVIPSNVVDEVLTEAERLTETEVAIRRALREGMSLAECLQRYGHV
jgi:4-hydroxy-4-methyl-2-oxoglutarate aldolase